jgi:hypothetical protein
MEDKAATAKKEYEIMSLIERKKFYWDLTNRPNEQWEIKQPQSNGLGLGRGYQSLPIPFFTTNNGADIYKKYLKECVANIEAAGGSNIETVIDSLTCNQPTNK